MLGRRSRGAVAALLVWVLFPGSSEASEQIVHLLRNGHFAHSIPADPDEGPLGTEHGCQGAMHICRCCPSAPASVTQVVLLSPPAATAARSSRLRVAHTDPHLLLVFHPPRA